MKKYYFHIKRRKDLDISTQWRNCCRGTWVSESGLPERAIINVCIKHTIYGAFPTKAVPLWNVGEAWRTMGTTEMTEPAAIFMVKLGLWDAIYKLFYFCELLPWTFQLEDFMSILQYLFIELSVWMFILSKPFFFW